MNVRITKKLIPFIVLIVLSLVIISCEDEGGNSNSNAPADHTVSQDGVMHKTGFNQPLTNCISCHGEDLQGGSAGVSCYDCHGKEW